MGAACESCPNGQLHDRVGMLEQQMARQTVVLESIEATLARLAMTAEHQIRIDERQCEQTKAIGRAFDGIAGIDTRVRALESSQPESRLVSGWVLEAVKWLAFLGIGALAGKALL